MEYLREVSDDKCMDDEPSRPNDKEAQEIIRSIVGVSDWAASLKMIFDQPDKYVGTLRKAGLSIRQISRLTGLSIGTVRK